jgi:hypothetical protein
MSYLGLFFVRFGFSGFAFEIPYDAKENDQIGGNAKVGVCVA